MNAAERYAALKAVKSAVDAAIRVAEREVTATMNATSASQFKVSLGTISYVSASQTIMFDDDALLAWAQENTPWEVDTAPRVRDTLRKQFKIIGDDVVHEPSGEIVTFARVRPYREATVAVKLADDTKQRADEIGRGFADQIARLLELQAE